MAGGGGLNAVENDSGYFSVGGYLSLTTGKQNIHVLQTDFNGDILFRKIYGDTSYHYVMGFQNSLVKLTQGGYTMYGGKIGGTNGSAVAILFRFDEQGDTLWTKTYGDTTNFQTGRHMRQTADGGFILLADDKTTNASHWVIKTDSLGVIEWQQHYGGPQAEGPAHIAVCSDKGYIFVGGSNSGGVNATNGNIRISKLDSLGNVDFTKFFGLSLAEQAWCVEPTQDGGYIFGGGITRPSDGITTSYAIRLDSLGDTLWTRTYTPPVGNGSGNGFRTIFELPDGSFLGGGQEFFTDSISFGRYDGLIIKLNPNGDTLWHKTYRIPYMNANGTDFEIKDIRPTTDGGFICGGVVYPAFPDTGTQDMWVFKIDSNGCVDTTNCYISTSTREVVHTAQQLLIYPNPTNGIFTLEIPKSIPKLEASFQLLNITGKVVLSKTIHSYSSQLDVSLLPKGVYFYRYFNTELHLNYTGKIVVQ